MNDRHPTSPTTAQNAFPTTLRLLTLLEEIVRIGGPVRPPT
jgi:hypothetical protein